MLIYIIIGYGLSYFGTRWYIDYCKKNRYMGVDRHKEKGEAALMGGIPVLISFLITMLLYLVGGARDIETYFLVMISMTLVTLVGTLDDFSKHNGGLTQLQKPLLSILGVIPLALIQNGTVLDFGMLGTYNLGGLHLFFTAVVFIGCTNMVNLLAGYNGLEVGLASIYILNLAGWALAAENTFVVVLSIILFSVLLGFMKFNYPPSLIFPGDGITYLLGAYLGIVATVGKMPVQVAIVSIPFFIEFILKARSRFQAQSFSKLGKDDKLEHDGPVYSLPQFFTKTKKFDEVQVVMIIYIIELICCVTMLGVSYLLQL